LRGIAVHFLGAATAPGFFLQASQKGAPPIVGGSCEILRAKSFDDLCLRQPVTQALSLRIPQDRDGFQEHRHEVGAGHEQHDVAPHRVHRRAGPSGLDADDGQPQHDLADALPSDRIAHQQVDGATRQRDERIQIPVEEPGRHEQQPVYGCGEQPLLDVRFRVGRHQRHGQAGHGREVEKREECRRNGVEE